MERASDVRAPAYRQPRSRLARLVAALITLPLATVIAIAVAVRLLAGVALPATSTDDYEFGLLARNIVEGDGYSYLRDDPRGRVEPDRPGVTGEPLPSAYMPPVYTYLTAAAMKVGGSHAGTVWALRAVHIAIAAGAVALLDALARRLVGPAGRLAALGYALYPAMVYFSTQVSAANLYLPLELASLLLLLRAAEAPSWRRWAPAGAALGALCLLRAEAVVLIPAAALWLVWASGRTPAGRSPAVRAAPAAVFLAAAAVLPGLWLVRNWVVLDTPVAAVTTTGGKNLWIGNHPGATGSQKDFEISPEVEDEIVALPSGDDFEVRSDRVYLRAALDHMADDPLAVVTRDLRKAGLLLGADVYDSRNLNPLYLGPYLALVVIGTAGAVGWWQRRPPGDPVRWLVAGYAGFAVAVPVVFFALARYRLPLEALLLIFAAGAVASGVARIARPVTGESGRRLPAL
jgi:hypothetical protein